MLYLFIFLPHCIFLWAWLPQTLFLLNGLRSKADRPRRRPLKSARFVCCCQEWGRVSGRRGGGGCHGNETASTATKSLCNFFLTRSLILLCTCFIVMWVDGDVRNWRRALCPVNVVWKCRRAPSSLKRSIVPERIRRDRPTESFLGRHRLLKRGNKTEATPHKVHRTAPEHAHERRLKFTPALGADSLQATMPGLLLIQKICVLHLKTHPFTWERGSQFVDMMDGVLCSAFICRPVSIRCDWHWSNRTTLKMEQTSSKRPRNFLGFTELIKGVWTWQ